jgi:RHS repeat-associated protein
LLAEHTGDGALVTRYYPEGYERVSGSSAGRYFYTRDHLGSIREVVDANNAVVARFTYDPFGRRYQVAGNEPVDLGYTGHHLHQATGLWLTHYRAYDAETGRWLSRDPIEEEGGFNLYGYVGNSPINLLDPLGLEGCESDVLESLTAQRESIAQGGLVGRALEPVAKSVVLSARIGKLRGTYKPSTGRVSAGGRITFRNVTYAVSGGNRTPITSSITLSGSSPLGEAVAGISLSSSGLQPVADGSISIPSVLTVGNKELNISVGLNPEAGDYVPVPGSVGEEYCPCK